MDKPRALALDTMAESFFYQNASWGYTPGKETKRQGRIKGAKSLAGAERYAAGMGWSFSWEPDPEPWEGDCEPPREVFGCILRDEDGHVLASLWSIGDPDHNYTRVVQAELALEAMPSFEPSAEMMA